MRATKPKGRWTQPQLFQQKGWIANNFQVKNNVSAMLKSKKRNLTEQNRDEMTTKSPFGRDKSLALEVVKPATAPEGKRNHRKLLQNFDQIGRVSSLCETRYSNFKTTIGNRKPLLFIKPYMRYQDNSQTMDQRKSEIYREINNPDLNHYQCDLGKKGAIIEYMTQYKESYAAETPRSDRIRPKSTQQRTMNVLAQKLKKLCTPSLYQKRMHALKDQ